MEPDEFSKQFQDQILEDFLTQFEAQILDDPIFLRDLIAQGYRLSDAPLIIKGIKEQVREQFENSSLPHTQLKKSVDDTFAVLVIANGFRLSAAMLNNILHTRGHINEDEVICLWLGLFYEQSPYCEGLWQIYADYRAVEVSVPLHFPLVITKIFGAPEGDAQNETQTLTQDSAARELDRFDRLIEVQDEFQRLIQDYWQKQLNAANEALQRIGKPLLQEDDIPKLIAWILDTKQAGKDPDTAARELDKTSLRAYKCLRMGYNTLLCEYLKDVYQAIDSVK